MSEAGLRHEPPGADQGESPPGEAAAGSARQSAPIAREAFVIQPSRGWAPLRLRQLWTYRELVYFIVWRDIKVRYKQTALGASWAVIQPFLTMVVFSVFFGSLIGVPSDGVPYPVFAFAALVPWTFFATALTESGNSLVNEERMLSKIYFPRLVLPLAAVLAGLLDLAIAFVVLIGLLLFYGIVPGFSAVTVPAFVLLAVVTALGAGLWLSALNVTYRDVRHAVSFIVQLWLFLTPVVYPASLVPEGWSYLYSVNPMVGVVEGFRWALTGGAQAPDLHLVVSIASAITLTLGGLFYFRRMERGFADVI